MKFPNNLRFKLNQRIENNALRKLNKQTSLIDFTSNDYLGFSKSETIFEGAHQYLLDNNIKKNGSTGSRLLTGNHNVYNEVETTLCKFHKSEAALIFNSGYDANIGFFSSVPQRGDIIIYDELIHASIRDGIIMSNAKSYKFKHNNLKELESLIVRHSELVSKTHQDISIYIITESVFSMDGDSPDLVVMSQITRKHNTYLIIDEAHAVGVLGENGVGLVQELGLQKDIFARLITFGKALGCHGAAILGSEKLKQYLLNFARSFIYTTALPPHSLATIKMSYKQLASSSAVENSSRLHKNIQYFKSEIERLQISISPLGEMSKGQWGFIKSNSAIHCCIVSGNQKLKSIAQKLQNKGFDVKPILSPTVIAGQERLRFCLHSFNTKKEISNVLHILKETIN